MMRPRPNSWRALHEKGETADEIALFAELLMERAIDPA